LAGFAMRMGDVGNRFLREHGLIISSALN
jgi:hypothetical protein